MYTIYYPGILYDTLLTHPFTHGINNGRKQNIFAITSDYTHTEGRPDTRMRFRRFQNKIFFAVFTLALL